jgi:hypothetical protein
MTSCEDDDARISKDRKNAPARERPAGTHFCFPQPWKTGLRCRTFPPGLRLLLPALTVPTPSGQQPGPADASRRHANPGDDCTPSDHPASAEG